MSEFSGLDNYGKPKQDYIDKLINMTEEDLLSETSSKIYMSAWANNNPRSDYHWQCDACWYECKRRDRLDIYDSAYKENVS